MGHNRAGENTRTTRKRRKKLYERFRQELENTVLRNCDRSTLIPIIEVKIRPIKDYKIGDTRELEESIVIQGFSHPILIDEDNFVILGRKCIVALKKLGLRYVPVKKVTQKDLEMMRGMELKRGLGRDKCMFD